MKHARPYLWTTSGGIVDANGLQVLQLLTNTTKKFRTQCGLLLVDALNKQPEKVKK